MRECAKCIIRMSQYLMDRINLHADCILTVPLIKIWDCRKNRSEVIDNYKYLWHRCNYYFTNVYQKIELPLYNSEFHFHIFSTPLFPFWLTNKIFRKFIAKFRKTDWRSYVFVRKVRLHDKYNTVRWTSWQKRCEFFPTVQYLRTEVYKNGIKRTNVFNRY